MVSFGLLDGFVDGLVVGLLDGLLDGFSVVSDVGDVLGLLDGFDAVVGVDVGLSVNLSLARVVRKSIASLLLA